MVWDVVFTDEYADWLRTLDEQQLGDVRASIRLLGEQGPRLARPYADTLKGSRHTNMKELRTQSVGKPLRSLFAFDPERKAVVLIGGEKTGEKRFYKDLIPQADEIFDRHLTELKKKENE